MICRQCKKEVADVHVCGMMKDKPIIVQYVNRYPANRGPEFMKRFGSQSPSRAAARKQNEIDKGFITV